MKKVGLVTVTYNGEAVIPGFMQSLKNQDYDNYILYVIDNVSTDNTLAEVEKHIIPNKTIVIKNDVNNGVAGGNNQGIKKALDDNCDFVLLINNDVEFESTLISKLVQTSNNTGFSVIVPKMMYYSEPNIIWFAGGYFNKRMGYANYHVGMNEEDKHQYADRLITYAPTCCALIKKEVFEDIGLMDEKYFVYYDDTDFWYRMLKDGRHKMYYIDDVEFYHKVGSSAKTKQGTWKKFTFNAFSIKYQTRNKVYYLKKQKSLWSYANIFYFWFRLNLRFMFSGKYKRDFKTWSHLAKSYYEGLTL